MLEPKNTFEEFFSKKHNLSSVFLNKLGAPVLRNILINSIINLRSYRNRKLKNDFELELIKNGIILIPNFLPNNDFENLKKEFKFLISQKKDEDRLKGVKSTTIKNHEFDQYPAMNKLRNNDKLKSLICAGEGLKQVKLQSFFIENTKFGTKEHQTQDRNSFYHADVHFHSHKVFYYMSDITEEHGPFTYLKKTHKNNFARLLYEFKRGRLSNATEKSWRIEDNLENSFLKNYFEKLLKNKYKAVGLANTLVIGNVHGFHKLGDASEGKERELIRITFRHNPLEILSKIGK
jgi:hypothetical protein